MARKTTPTTLIAVPTPQATGQSTFPTTKRTSKVLQIITTTAEVLSISETVTTVRYTEARSVAKNIPSRSTIGPRPQGMRMGPTGTANLLRSVHICMQVARGKRPVGLSWTVSGRSKRTWPQQERSWRNLMIMMTKLSDVFTSSQLNCRRRHTTRFSDISCSRSQSSYAFLFLGHDLHLSILIRMDIDGRVFYLYYSSFFNS